MNQTVTESTPVEDEPKIKSEPKIVTTPEEIEAYTVTKLILKDSIDPTRIVYRDNQSYFNVLIDDNIRKWVIRIYFKSNRNFIVLNDGKNTELEFDTPLDISNYSEQINNIVEDKIKI